MSRLAGGLSVRSMLLPLHSKLDAYIFLLRPGHTHIPFAGSMAK
jgi:hypothetical protein